MAGWLLMVAGGFVAFAITPRDWGLLSGLFGLIMVFGVWGALAKLADVSFLISIKDIKDKWRNHE